MSRRQRAYVLFTALSLVLGTRYRWGGDSAETGFDASGLMQWAYGRVGVRLPRTIADQANFGTSVDRSALLPGDLLFFADAGYVHDVGMYIDRGRFVHVRPGQVVEISSLRDPYYGRRLAGARRIC